MEESKRHDLNREPIIVIIDDDKAISPLLTRILRVFRERLKIASFEHSEVALSYIHDHKTDLIFTDLNGDTIMPFQYFRDAVSKTINSNTPIVKISGTTPPDNIPDGSVAFLGKPFDLQAIGCLLDMYIPASEQK